MFFHLRAPALLATAFASAVVANYDYIGCYKDDGDRDFDHGPYHDGLNSNYDTTLCNAACVGYRYFAMQYGGECFCDDSYGDPAATYPKIEDDRCMSRDCGGSCGGGWANAVYSVVPNFDYIGCFTDDDKRDFDYGPYHDGLDSDYDTTSCNDACQGYQYFALQYGGECFCDNIYGDNTDISLYPRITDNLCNSGDCGGPCGGGWANSVYHVVDKN